jgi:Kef-type K+ transport system membrane component KefB
MHQHALSDAFFLIFFGAALLATLALYTRQPILLAYIVLGGLIGPYGLGLVTDIELMKQVASIGIMFLLFLIGLDMELGALMAVIRQSALINLASSIIFFAAGYAVAAAFSFGATASVIIGMAMLNPSTIVSLKLLPTTVLHHKHTGELIIGISILQDLLALLLISMIPAATTGHFDLGVVGKLIVAMPLLLVLAYAAVKRVLEPLIIRFDRFHEYVFLLAIGWCMGVSWLAGQLGLSHETGAFIAGISLASSPIAQFIALNLRPLRDFFLVLFFFSLGAGFDLTLLHAIILPALVLTAVVVTVKPVVYRYLLGHLSEKPDLAWDVGFRLGQVSEFSLLIAFSAASSLLISNEASLLIQAVVILSFVVSTYIVIFNFPNPIAVSEALRRD